MKRETLDIVVNGRPTTTERGTTVAAALLNAGQSSFRSSVTGDVRGPVCGMGVCFECRVTIDDVPHQRACLTLVSPGMRILTSRPPV